MSALMPLARAKDVIIQEIDEECLVYDLKTNKALCLNTTSAEIWKRCNGTSTVKEVAQVIGQQMKVELDEDFIWLAIADLEKNNLLSEKPKRPPEFEKLSRRKVLFKYALPGLLAPVIASIVAPSAVNAASGAAPPPSCFASNTFLTFVPGAPPAACNGNPPTPNAACCSGQQFTMVNAGNCELRCV